MALPSFIAGLINLTDVLDSKAVAITKDTKAPAPTHTEEEKQKKLSEWGPIYKKYEEALKGGNFDDIVNAKVNYSYYLWQLKEGGYIDSKLQKQFDEANQNLESSFQKAKMENVLHQSNSTNVTHSPQPPAHNPPHQNHPAISAGCEAIGIDSTAMELSRIVGVGQIMNGNTGEVCVVPQTPKPRQR